MISSRLRAGLRGSVSARLRGQSDVVLNANASTYIAALTTAGYTPDYTEKIVLSNWFNAGAANGWYAKIYDFGLLTWGSSAPCLLRGKVGGSITQVAGSVSYTSKRAALSSNGYFNLGHSSSSAGMSTSGCMGFALAGTIADAAAVDMGSQNASTTYWQVYSNAFTTNVVRLGNGTTAASQGGASGNNPGLYLGNRITTQLDLFRYNGTKTTLASRSDASGGAADTRNFFLGASNENGTPLYFTNRAYTFWFTGIGFTSTERDNFMVDTYTMLSDLGAT